MKRHLSTSLTALFVVTACAGGKHNDWDSIDYSSVYRKAAQRENDTSYRAPSIVGCFDEDLYNCGR